MNGGENETRQPHAGDDGLPITLADLTDFQRAIHDVLPSVIPVAVGTDERGAPDIVGTAFAAEYGGMYLTCAHVATEEEKATTGKAAVRHRRIGSDGKLRLGLPQDDGTYAWTILDEGHLFAKLIISENDVCSYHARKSPVRPLKLRRSQHILVGEEAALVGFPMGNKLQPVRNRPYVARAIVAGIYDRSEGISGRLIALDTAVAGGFSGGPIVSVRDGTVIGMIASSKYENTRWPANITLGIESALLLEFLEFSARQVAPLFAAQEAASEP